MYKAVFSDFDGTLLTSDHEFRLKTLDAIQRITKQGIPFTPNLCSFAAWYLALCKTH